MKTRQILIIGVIVVIILLAVLIVVKVLTGSSSSRSSNSGAVVLNYWGLWEPEEVMTEVINKYQQSNPNVTINYVQKNFGHTNQTNLIHSGNYPSTLIGRLSTLQSADTIDIVRIHNSWLPMLQDYLYPVTQFMTVDEYKNTFYPTAYTDFVDTQGNIYAIPLQIDGLVLFYNKDIFTQYGITSPPQDWDEVISTAQKLTTKDTSGQVTRGGIGLGTGSNITHAFDISLMMLTQANVEVINSETGQPSFATSSLNSGADAVEYYLDFAKKHQIWSYRLPNDLNSFVAGNLAMMIAPSWRVFDLINMNSSLNFDVAPLPVLPGANPDTPQYLASYWAEAISKNSQHPEEAYKFLRYLSEPEQLRTLYNAQINITKRAFGEPYPRPDMANELQDSPYVKSIIAMAPYMKGWQLGDIAQWEDVFKNMLINLETSEATQTELDQAQQQLTTTE